MLFRRPLLPCLLAYLLGLLMIRLLFDLGGTAMAAGLVLAGAALLGCAVHYRNFSFVTFFFVMLAGCAVMNARLGEQQTAGKTVASLEDGRLREITGTVGRIRRDSETGISRCELSDVRISSGTRAVLLSGKLALTLEQHYGSLPGTGSFRNLDITRGDRLRVLATVHGIHGFHNFFGYDFERSMEDGAEYARATVTDASLVQRINETRGIYGRISHFLDRVRWKCRAIFRRSMPGHEARLMIAMMFNDISILGESDQQVFRDSNTFHLFAVSGLHIGVMALGLVIFFRFLRLSRKWAWTASTVALFAYLWLIDFVVPAERAWIMAFAFTLGLWCRRQVDALSALILSCTIIILLDPLAPWQAGFQLSVLGVFAIVTFLPIAMNWVEKADTRSRHWSVRWFQRIKWGVVESLIVTLSVTFLILPLQLHYFSRFNLVSPLANLVQAFLSGLVISGGLITLAAGAVSAGLGVVFGHGAAILMHWLYEISRVTAETRWANWRPGELPVSLVVAYLLVVLCGYYFVRRDTPEFRVKSRARMVTHLCCGAGILFSWSILPSLVPGNLRIYFLDVGQGDSTLILLPNRQTILVDAGKRTPDMGRLVVDAQLQGMGIHRIDYLVATHPDEDHVGGIPWLLKHFEVGRVMEPDCLDRDVPLMDEIHDVARRRKVPVVRVHAGAAFHEGRVKVDVLNPTAASAGADVADNDKSVVLSVWYGRFHSLLMGDAGIPVEQELIREHVVTSTTLLKVGHHGSHTASGDPFLDKASPTFSLISCGLFNRFHHPAPSVVARLEKHRSRILRTDRSGAAYLDTDGNRMKIETVVDGLRFRGVVP